jgi:hypothetical protein
MLFPRSSDFTVITVDEVGASAQMEDKGVAEIDIKVREGGVAHTPPIKSRNPESL